MWNTGYLINMRIIFFIYINMESIVWEAYKKKGLEIKRYLHCIQALVDHSVHGTLFSFVLIIIINKHQVTLPTGQDICVFSPAQTNVR